MRRRSKRGAEKKRPGFDRGAFAWQSLSGKNEVCEPIEKG
jgi:hypothetical protein